jgi:MAP/microtubule affinity-regulating kinase
MPIAQQNNHNLPATFGNYRVVRALAEGSTCTVAEAIDRNTGQTYAVKILASGDSLCCDLTDAIEREVRLLGSLDHPNIVKLYEVVHENGHVFVVLEHCEGGTLLDLILSDTLQNVSEVKRLFRPIADAVSYLHGRGIAHGDIKPDNIVLTADGDAKLIDFGYSKEMLIGFDEDKSGTVKYCAPELFCSSAYDTRKADVWSLGILLFVMATGTFPYRSSDDEVVRLLVSSGQVAGPDRIAAEFAELYGALTNRSPSQRPTVDAIVNSQCLCAEDVQKPETQKVTDHETGSENELDGMTPF